MLTPFAGCRVGGAAAMAGTLEPISCHMIFFSIEIIN